MPPRLLRFSMIGTDIASKGLSAGMDAISVQAPPTLFPAGLRNL